jgi:hypothetical protein
MELTPQVTAAYAAAAIAHPIRMSITKCSPPYTNVNAIASVYAPSTTRTSLPAGQKNSISMNG